MMEGQVQPNCNEAVEQSNGNKLAIYDHNSQEDLLLFKRNPFHHLVDSFPFVDMLPVDMEAVVMNLVKEEMEDMRRERGCSEEEILEEYVRPLAVTTEGKQVEDGPKCDFTKYNTLRATKLGTRADLEHGKMLLEYAQLNLINLELLDRYKEGAWLKYLDSIQAIRDRYGKVRDELEARLSEVGKRRKLSHVETANKIRGVNQEREEYRSR